MAEIFKRVKLVPFAVTNYVMQEMPLGRREGGIVESPKYHLGELDNDTLSELCRQFREDVLAKAAEFRK